MAPLPLRIDGTKFRDSKGREVTFRGINVDGSAKFPRSPDQPSHQPSGFFDGENISFVGRPFTEPEAHRHFGRLRKWGYNTIRYIFTWEAIEHAGPGKYDEDFIQHTIKMLRIAKDFGFYVFMDPHQDVWSRFSGGSGAPLWTLYACGFNPEAFQTTQAAVVHNTYDNPAEYPKMIWSTNYTRLVCQTMFTLFYAGKDFAPNAVIDGKNIQDYLTDHFVGACKQLAMRIHEAGDLEDVGVIGWESLNEPNCGLVGWQDMTAFPAHVKMRKGTCPTPWQGLLTGSGRSVEMDTYEFGSFGPYKSGKVLVDPRGTSAWLPASYDDSKYGWKRDPGWRLGECIWAQHGVWDPKEDRILRKDYFSYVPKSGIKLDYEKFTNSYFMDHYRKYRNTMRSIHKDCIMFLQPAVLEIPPSIKSTADDDPNTVFATHYYDGLTLITKHWNRYYNVDVFGILRGRYLSPAFGLKVGETAIRNCLRDQLQAIREEGLQYMGIHPTVFTEIGIPYDMDDKHAYKTGDFGAQTAAMDANHFALEGSGANGFTLWTYVGENNHEWGDMWNGEDLSIFSVDDNSLPAPPKSVLPSANISTATLSNSESPTTIAVSPSNVQSALKHPQITQRPVLTSPSKGDLTSHPSLRAAEAFVRPSPITTFGKVVKYGFDLRNCVFTFTLKADNSNLEKSDTPTEIYLPAYHFPPSRAVIQTSTGKWRIDIDELPVDDESGEAGMQVLRWWHEGGEQNIQVTGIKRKIEGLQAGDEEGDEGEGGYFESMRKLASSSCQIM